MSFYDLDRAHWHCKRNETEIGQSDLAACFYCQKTYSSNDIAEWIEDGPPRTAECPKCGIDSVIGDASGFDFTEEFLQSMHDRWFSAK